MITNVLVYSLVKSSSNFSTAKAARHTGIFLIIMMLAAIPLPAIAKENSALQEKPETEVVSPATVPTAPVLLDGESLFYVRGISAYPAEIRAKKIGERLEGFAADVSRDLQTLRLVEEQNMTVILADKQPLLSVFEADGRLEGIGRQDLAQAYIERIKESVQTYRKQREPYKLFLHTLYALGATGILILGWFGLRWVFTRLDRIIERRYKMRVKDLSIQKLRIVQAGQMWAALRGTLKAVRFLVLLVLMYVYLSFVLRQFPWTAFLGEELFTLIVPPLRTIGNGLLANIPGLIIIGVLAVLTRSPKFKLNIQQTLLGMVRRGKGNPRLLLFFSALKTDSPV